MNQKGANATPKAAESGNDALLLRVVAEGIHDIQGYYGVPDLPSRFLSQMESVLAQGPRGAPFLEGDFDRVRQQVDVLYHLLGEAKKSP